MLNKIIDLTKTISWNNFEFFKHHLMINFKYIETIKNSKKLKIFLIR